jgi:hypothetical protein
MRPVLVVAGRRGVGRRTLMARIPGKRTHPLPSIAETEQPDIWRVDTKYFTASVRVCCAEVPADVVLDGAPCEGVVLVFDMLDDSSFKYLESWQPFLEQHDAQVHVAARQVFRLPWFCLTI